MGWDVAFPDPDRSSHGYLRGWLAISRGLPREINQMGEYGLYLSGKDENHADFTLEIPIAVGTQWYENVAQFWPLLLLIVGAIIFHIFRKL